MLSLAVLPWLHRTWTNHRQSRLTSSAASKLEEPRGLEHLEEHDGALEPAETSGREAGAPSVSMRERLSKARGMISTRLSGIRGAPVDSSMLEKLE